MSMTASFNGHSLDDGGVSTPLVSIIMPCYNASQFIHEAIESVRAQTVENWELLICDDSSTDESPSIISLFASRDSRIKCIPPKGKGAADARNSCLDVARGRYIAFLDSDDLWYPNKLEQQLDLMLSEGVHFCYSNYDCIDEYGKALPPVFSPRNLTFGALLYSNFIGCLTVVYDASFFGKVRQPLIRKRNDYALWLSMLGASRDASAQSVPESLGVYRVNSYGLSSKKLDLIKYYWLCVRRYGGVSRLNACYLMICYLVIIMTKKRLPRFYNLLIRIGDR